LCRREVRHGFPVPGQLFYLCSRARSSKARKV
jgi:hypothetical protein